ncbi:MAG: potH 1 [Actinomycetia bacterium]|nr:potH 1 [Actinomycetes bacterium]
MDTTLTRSRPHDGVSSLGWRVVDGMVAIRRRAALGKRSGIFPYLLVVPALLLTTVLVGGIGYMIWISFHSFDSFLQKQGPWSLDQYNRLFSSDNSSYIHIMQRTFTTSIFVTVCTVALALPTAYVIVRMRSRIGRSCMIMALLIPFLMGETVRAFSWLVLLGHDGAATWATGLFGWHADTFLGKSSSITIGLLQVMVPLATLILVPGVRKVTPDYERAAQTMGARPWQIWLRIIVPLARPSLAAASVIVFMLSMTEYAIPSVLGLGSKPFVANSVQNIFFGQGNIYFGAAYSVVLIGIVAVAGLVLLVSVRGKGRRAPDIDLTVEDALVSERDLADEGVLV